MMTAAFVSSRFTRRVKEVPATAFAIAALVIAMAWYVLAANAYVAMQYAISDAGDTHAALREEIESLETRLAGVAQPEALEAHANELGFMAIRKPRYLTVPGDAVARR